MRGLHEALNGHDNGRADVPMTPPSVAGIRRRLFPTPIDKPQQRFGLPSLLTRRSPSNSFSKSTSIFHTAGGGTGGAFLVVWLVVLGGLFLMYLLLLRGIFFGGGALSSSSNLILSHHGTNTDQQSLKLLETGSKMNALMETVPGAGLRHGGRGGTLSKPVLESTYISESPPNPPKYHQKTQQQGSLQLTPLGPRDFEEYTIRINTWNRNEQLLISVDHHASCPGVAQIQVIWCDLDHEPPHELFNHTSHKVVVERHVVNSLNARFDIQSSNPRSRPPTLGILSIDDDVLRPCEALDAGFFKWTQSPHRMVGFDGRLHVEKEDGSWAYGYMSTMEKANQYSLSLTRYCFLHRDYLDWYTTNLPRPIFNKVAENFNCEDIAMSFMISSFTNGQPPLLADRWAIKTMIKVYTQSKISGSKNHKALRDDCVNSFAELLGLKGDDGGRGAANLNQHHRLEKATYVINHDMFECGAPVDNLVERSDNTNYSKSERHLELEAKIQSWRQAGSKQMSEDLRRMMSNAGVQAYRHGLIENTDKWKKRFHH